MTLACLYLCVAKTNQSPSALYNLHLLSFLWGKLQWSVDGNTRCFRNRTFLVLKRVYLSLIYKWSRYKSTGQINYPSNRSSTGLSGWVHAKQNNSHKNQETWRVRKTNALWIFSQNKIKCSGQLSLRTPYIHPPVISFFYSVDTSQGLFCPAYTGHFNSRI